MPEPSPIPVIIDVEASGFGRGSYPIEVGMAMADGTAHCYLIKPYEDWLHWETEAEKLHLLSRETVLQYGNDGHWVAQQLNDLLAGQTIYTDAWGNDSAWLALLYDRAGILQRFRVEHLISITSEEQKMRWDAMRMTVTNELGLQRHRASSDAKIIQSTWLRTLEMPLNQSGGC